jgi:catechol 2,3-dioxygenase-like lactoylglutathione lyase family enzyme
MDAGDTISIQHRLRRTLVQPERFSTIPAVPLKRGSFFYSLTLINKNPFMAITGTNVTLMVRDMDEAVSFYQGIGLHLKQRWGNNYAMMTTEGLTIGLHPSEDPNTHSGSVSIGFMVPKIQEAMTLLDSKQITYHLQDDGKSGTYLHFKDPFGTVLYFVEPKWS